MANGVVAWKGISQIDGKTPIVLVMTGFGRTSRNPKTGAMLQTYIIRSDMSPLEAFNGLDGGICGGCVHRKNMATGKRTCYVRMDTGPRAVFDAYTRGVYSRLGGAALRSKVRGQYVRVGTYGDPAAVPFRVWSLLLQDAGGYTGYTHQWRSAKFRDFGALLQASCETEEDVAAAHARGYRGTFRVLPIGADVPNGVLHCPASAERGKLVTCNECLACSGKTDVVIHAHGAGRTRYTGSRQLPVL